MNLLSYLPNESTEKIIAEGCTLGQAFTMIDNWCYDNNAEFNWDRAYKYDCDPDFFIQCFDKDTHKLVINFIITWN